MTAARIPVPLAPGDDGRYAGKVLRIVGDMAEVEERRNPLLGRDVIWHLRLDALTRLPRPASR